MLTGEMIRAARAMGRLEQTELAKLADVSVDTIKRLEKIEGKISANSGTLEKIHQAFAKRGVIMIDDPNNNVAGVMMALNRDMAEKMKGFGRPGLAVLGGIDG